MNYSNLLAVNMTSVVIAVLVGLFLLGLVALVVTSTKDGKYWIGGILLTIFLAVTTFSAVEVGTYYKAKGGIWGKIEKPYKIPAGDVIVDVEQLKFDFQNISLALYDDGYSANISVDDVIDLENTKYTLLVNGTPCGVCENSTDYILGQYTYSFMNSKKEELLLDTLYISIVFNELGTNCIVRTAGDDEAYKNWNYYFAKNGFVVTIEKGGYVEPDSWEFIVEGQLHILKTDITEHKQSVESLSSNVEALKQEVSNYLSLGNTDSNKLDYYENQFNLYLEDINNLTKSNLEYINLLESFKQSNAEHIETDSQMSELISSLRDNLTSCANRLVLSKNTINQYLSILSDDAHEIIIVNYVSEGKTLTTQSINSGDCPSAVDEPLVAGSAFKGWSLGDNKIVEPTSMPLNNNTTFVAEFFSNEWEATTFNIEFEGRHAYSFDGNSYAANADAYYMFNYERDWIKQDGLGNLSPYHYWTDNDHLYASMGPHHYEIFSDGTCEEVSFGGITEFYAKEVWQDEEDTFLSTTFNYEKLDFILNKETRTWEPVTIKNKPSNFSADKVWRDTGKTYYSDGTDDENLEYSFVWEKTTFSWIKYMWYDYITIIPTKETLRDMDGSLIWNIKNVTYYSWSHKLDSETMTWVEVKWEVPEGYNLDLKDRWTDGVNYYISSGSKHLILI